MNKSYSSVTSDERDDYPKVTQADLDRATFRVGLKPAPRKRRVTILLDTGLVEYFKAQAGERGYQTLINETLRQAVERDDLEERLRRLIREEMRREVVPAGDVIEGRVLRRSAHAFPTVDYGKNAIFARCR